MTGAARYGCREDMREGFARFASVPQARADGSFLLLLSAGCARLPCCCMLSFYTEKARCRFAGGCELGVPLGSASALFNERKKRLFRTAARNCNRKAILFNYIDPTKSCFPHPTTEIVPTPNRLLYKTGIAFLRQICFNKSTTTGCLRQQAEIRLPLPGPAT